MLNWLFRKGAKENMTRTPDQIAWLGTVRRDVIPDPAVLRARLDALTRQISVGDTDFNAEFDRIDRHGDSAAFLRLQPMAERQEERKAQAAVLPAQIRSAERREAAFLELVEECEAIQQDEQALLDMLIDQPPADAEERRQTLRVLEETTRLHLRVKLHLRGVSTSPRFKEPPDALNTLRGELENRLRELDRIRVPGMKPRFAAPPEIAALIEAMDGRTPRKEIAHAV